MAGTAVGHTLRTKLLGLNAAQQRFDVLQNRADQLLADVGRMEDTLAGLAGSLEALRATVQHVEGRLIPIGHGVARTASLQRSITRIEARLQSLEASGRAHAAAHAPAPEPPAFRLAFLVHAEELVNHFASVWDHLPAASFDVILHNAAVGCRPDTFRRWACGVVTSDEVCESGHRYDYLVSNHPVALGDKPLLRQLARHQVRFMYAAGKSGWNLADWNGLYDVILCFGPHHAARFAATTRAAVVQMGYPRFDRYFNAPPDREALCQRYGCDPARSTVVWLPTWKTLSSVGHFDAEVSALTQAYNVVVKLHPLMVEQEPERVEALRRHSFTHLVTDASDNLPLYQIADYMLFDYGGPPLAGVYADKRMLLLNVPGAAADGLLTADSPDLAIREQLASVEPGADQIFAHLADARLWEDQRAQRHALRGKYFAPYYGFSSAVAASALLRLPRLAARP